MMHVISIWTVLLSCTAVSSAPQAAAALPVAQVVGLAAGPNFTLPRAFVVPNTCTNAGVPRVPHVPPPAVEEPGHDVEFSIIIEVKGSHVYPGWLDCYLSWLTARAKAGLGSLERGKKNEHLHIQAVARVRVRCVDKSQINQLRKEIKAAIGVRHNDGSGCQVAINGVRAGPNVVGHARLLHEGRGQTALSHGTLECHRRSYRSWQAGMGYGATVLRR